MKIDLWKLTLRILDVFTVVGTILMWLQIAGVVSLNWTLVVMPVLIVSTLTVGTFALKGVLQLILIYVNNTYEEE